MRYSNLGGFFIKKQRSVDLPKSKDLSFVLKEKMGEASEALASDASQVLFQDYVNVTNMCV